MNIERIKELRDFLATVPDENFNHASWEGFAYKADEFILEDKNVCGTTACIGGWAAIHAKLVPWTVNEKHQIIFEDDAYDELGEAAALWLELDEKEKAILFYPFDIYYDSFVDFGWSKPPMSREEYQKLRDGGALGSNTKVSEAIAMLDKIIENGYVDIMWWAEVKGKN